jgi:hypothetical protein
VILLVINEGRSMGGSWARWGCVITWLLWPLRQGEELGELLYISIYFSGAPPMREEVSILSNML